MSYTLKLTNGKVLLTLPDQQSDRVSTSLTLIGKNVNAYGTDINQNYIRILENFANSTAPNAPLIGQLWYDTNAQTLKIYTRNNQFKTVGAPVISASEPLTLGVGEFWYDTTAEQMKFKADSNTMVVVGPQFDASAGKSGWVNQTIYDTSNNSQTVVSLYSNDVLMGVLTSQPIAVRADYTTATAGMSTLGVGFNAVSTFAYETKWIGTALKANYLVDINSGVQSSPSDFIRDIPGGLVSIDEAASVSIRTDFTVGPFDNFRINSRDSWDSVYLRSEGTNKDLRLEVNSNAPYSGKGSAVIIKGTNNCVGFFNDNPQYDVDVKGDVRIDGNLLVNGSSTFITSQDLKVIDRNISLGETTNPDDTTANGGGIILRSLNRDKEIRWYNSTTDNTYTGTPNTWVVTDNLELPFINSAYYIYGDKVLDRTSLGVQVKSAPGLTEIGSLASLNVGTIAITTSANTTTIGHRLGFSDITLKIGDGDTRELSFMDARKVTAPYPGANEPGVPLPGELDNHVATVKYVEDKITRERNPTVSISIDVTGKANSKDDPNLDVFVQEMLTFLWDPADPDPNYRAPELARARVICIRYQTIQIDNVPSAYMQPGVPLYVDKDGIQSAVATMPWSEYYRVTTTLPASDLTIQRVVKEYVVDGAAWKPRGGLGGLNNIVSSTGTIHTNSGWYWDNP